MGRWSARHRRRAILGWFAFVLLAFAAGAITGTKDQGGNDGIAESGRADAILDRAFPDVDGESVLVQARRGGNVRDPEVRAATADVVAAVKGTGTAREVDATRVSRDGRSRLIAFQLPDADGGAEDKVRPIMAAVERAAGEHPGVFVGQFGDASAEVALGKALDDDFKRAEMLSLPVTLAVLLVAFGALVAAGVPLLLGLSAVAATLGLVGVLSHAVPMDDAVSSVVLLIGLAVGVDYTLFYMRREREERHRGASPRDALAIAASTSGRAILVSGITVMVAMAGMLFAGDPTFVSLGLGSMMVVAVAMIGSVTVVPALLAWLGDRVERGRIPLLGRRRGARGGSGGRREPRAWAAILRVVLRRPAIAALLSAGLLAVLAWPALGMKTALPSLADLPKDLPVTQTYDRLQSAFPGGQVPGVVAVRAADVTAPEVRSRIAVLERAVDAAPHLNGPVEVSVSPDRTVASIHVPMAGTGTDTASMAGLRELRSDVVPEAFGGLAGVETGVTGEAAGTRDFNDRMAGRAPLVFAFVLGFAFLLMLVTFRSLVIPIKAILMNLLSVGAAYGILVWVFQHGHLEGLLGFEAPGAVVSWLPMFLFVILFGLSMDYHVFILSRVREAWARGVGMDRAVAEGITATAGTVTSAAAVMVAVFAIFATLGAIDFKMMGVGPRHGDPARRDDRPRRPAAGDHEAARRVELVPAAVARVAAPGGARGAGRRASRPNPARAGAGAGIVLTYGPARARRHPTRLDERPQRRAHAA
jgi:RND superfamily putative drug exporter